MAKFMQIMYRKNSFFFLYLLKRCLLRLKFEFENGNSLSERSTLSLKNAVQVLIYARFCSLPNKSCSIDKLKIKFLE